MGVFDYEVKRIKQQEIEVKALVALMRFGRNSGRRLEAESRLCKIAFPETVAKEINEENHKQDKINEFIKNAR